MSLEPDIFQPVQIKNVRFRNRLIRSSIGGRNAYYDGRVNDAWVNFERRFAVNNVGGIVSATFTVDEQRWSPLEYPSIADDYCVEPLGRAIQEVKRGQRGLPYILQIGDPGYHTQTSLFPQFRDKYSSSWGFDFLYGYRSTHEEMPIDEINLTINRFQAAARRLQCAGCDGVEITISKGYLIHQFLNPGINRRTDDYGGSFEKRFRFLREIALAVRAAVGEDFLFGIRISARDYNWLPLPALLRWPFPWRGNGLSETVQIGQWLQERENGGIDYLHISNGFGFINPKENPGRFPTEEARMFLNSTRHLSRKAAWRAMIVNNLPARDWVLNLGWKFEPAANLPDACEFKNKLKIPIIVNGAFQDKWEIEQALSVCDMVSMARPLLANPDLPRLLEEGCSPTHPCTHCNRCTLRTTLFPLGCYEPLRFTDFDEMEDQILHWSNDPTDEQYKTLPARQKLGFPRESVEPVQMNFGRNVRFKPQRWCLPHAEEEVLSLLADHVHDGIRVLGSGHAWSDTAASDGVMVDMRLFKKIEIRRVGSAVFVRAGAGATLKEVLKKLKKSGLTLPTIGVVTEQTVAGAISTGTHGSGNSSLSDHVVAITAAAYDQRLKPRFYTFTKDDELRAARCGLGRTGIIVNVTFRCVPQFYVSENVRFVDSLDEVLSSERDFPLQEFGLVPYLWRFLVYQRRVVPKSEWRGWKRIQTWFYRAYKLASIDVGAHVSLKLVVALSRFRLFGSRIVKLFYRFGVPLAVREVREIIDKNTHALTRKHHWFRHVEMEVFLPREHVREATDFIREVTLYFAADTSQISRRFLEALPEDIQYYHGFYTHHYAIYFRRVSPDDTLISMTAGAVQDYYAIGFFSYDEPSRERYFKYAECLALGLNRLFGARLHWGKFFPLNHRHIRALYPRLPVFEEICTRLDPEKAFRNAFSEKALDF